MAELTMRLTFDGYWREPSISHIPAASGVYCVYACVHNSDNTVTLRKLIYIGESEDVNDRIKNHEKWKDWRRHVGAGQQLCFTFAPIDMANRNRAEAATINRHKPPENVEYKNEFPFDKTTMNIDGQRALLDAGFAVYRTMPVAASRL
jgi:excinuclease UvrABC nuclease subunit